jgi:diguanylate cyclase (GGDEF)-like protein
MNFASLLEKQSKPVLVLLSSAATLLVGVGDYFATNVFLEFSVFFLLPISFFTWFVSRRAGLLSCLISGGIVLSVNLISSVYVKSIEIAYWNAVLWTGFFVLITFIIADLRSLHYRERELARVDTLTGAATRLAFYEFARDEINRARRINQPITLAYLDIDSFKQINDQNGHSTGDKVLHAVAQTLRETIRRTDMVARMGGDEFALLLPNTSREAGSRLLEKVMDLLAGTMKQRGWPVTFSIGAVTFLSAPESVERMIEHADETMYSVKQTGKNRICQKEMAA